MNSWRKLRSAIRCYVDYNSMHPFTGKADTPLAVLRKIARDEKHRYYVQQRTEGPPCLPFPRLFQYVLWPLIVVLRSSSEIIKSSRLHGRSITQIPMDFIRMIRCSFRYNVSPEFYYFHRHYKQNHSEKEIARYQTPWEHHYIGRRIARIRKSDVAGVDNKDNFAKFCKEKGIPTIPTVDLANTDPGEIEPRDLFLKDCLSYGGSGCFLMPYNPGQQCWMLGERAVRAGELESAIREHLGSDRFVLQYRYRNHKDMLWLSKDVLTTIRIITAWDPDGKAVSLRASIRVPTTGDAHVDNASQGSVSLQVNPETGTLIGPAINYRKVFTAHHPYGTDRSFTGFQLPLWKDTVDTAIHAHVKAGNFNFLGWDLAITDSGPLITECNVWSFIDLVQVTHDTPFLTDEVIACYMAEPSLKEEFKHLTAPGL